MEFSEIEKRDIYEVYIQNRYNKRQAQREYRRIFEGQRRIPCLTTFPRIYHKVITELSFKRKKRTIVRNENYENEELEILLYFQENPEKSITHAAQALDKTYYKIRNTLKKYKYHPYKILPVQHLSEENKASRLCFCLEMMERLEQDGQFFNKIVWTDESSFSTAAVFNRKNAHCWASENPKAFREIKHSGRHSVHVWAGILNNRVMGPIFFDENLNGNRYLQLISDIIPNLTDNNEETIWQQDGTPAHNVAAVTQYLNHHFPFWIGRFGPLRWPPNSPDLTILDTFLWGFLKDKFKDERQLTVNRIREKIAEEVEILNGRDQGIILAAIEKQKRIYRKCIEQNGGHVEHLLQ